MGATLAWPTVAVLGFLVLTALVVVLGTSSTARYEFERNGARERRHAETPGHGAHPAGSRVGRPAAPNADGQPRPQAVDVAVRPAPGPTAGARGWWLVDESAAVVAGPFAEQLDAEWAALSEELEAMAVHGNLDADGGVALRPSPEDRAWLGELGDQLDRLPPDWDAFLTDTDPLTTLVVEVAAALVEAGLPLHDAPQGASAGGVTLLPDPAFRGVVVSWRAHDRMALRHLRGAAADATVQHSMNAAIAEVLANLGFVVEHYGATGSSLVTAIR